MKRMSCKHGNWEPCDECDAEDRRDSLMNEEIENLRAMYDAQCRCTDEWAEKYRAEVERKGDEALLRRVKELEDALAAVNSRLAAAQAVPNAEVTGRPLAASPATGWERC